MTHAVVATDREGVITRWDAGATTLFGHSAQAVVGRPVDLLVPEQLRDAHWTGFHRAMENPVVKDLAADLPVVCADGVIRTFAGRLLVVSDGLGIALGAMAIYTDAGTTGTRPFR
jgi:PAS domain S-box-containing protein